MSRDPHVMEVEGVVTSIMPFLAGRASSVQGAALSDLLAMFLAGHFEASGRAETDKLREALLEHIVATVRHLIPINEKLILKKLPRRS